MYWRTPTLFCLQTILALMFYCSCRGLPSHMYRVLYKKRLFMHYLVPYSACQSLVTRTFWHRMFSSLFYVLLIRDSWLKHTNPTNAAPKKMLKHCPRCNKLSEVGNRQQKTKKKIVKSLTFDKRTFFKF